MTNKGGSKGKTEYMQSPESQEMMRLMMPTMKRIGEAGATGGQLWDVGTYGMPSPSPPAGAGGKGGASAPPLAGGGGKGGGAPRRAGPVPSRSGPGPMGGAFAPAGQTSSGKGGGGAPPSEFDLSAGYGVGTYDLPPSMMPGGATQGQIAAGIRQPFETEMKQSFENLAAVGMGGSARGGVSGAGGAAMAERAAQLMPQMSYLTEQLYQPYKMAEYGAGVGQARDIWGAELGRGRDIYGAELGRAKDVWSQELMAKQFPYSVIPGMAGASMPSPVVSQGGGKK